jgi:uncharacterized protein
MKYLIFLFVLVGGLWLLWGQWGRSRVPPEARKKKPESMVQCAQCGLHLPRSEALLGLGSIFYDEQHRRIFEQSTHE